MKVSSLFITGKYLLSRRLAVAVNALSASVKFVIDAKRSPASPQVVGYRGLKHHNKRAKWNVANTFIGLRIRHGHDIPKPATPTACLVFVRMQTGHI